MMRTKNMKAIYKYSLLLLAAIAMMGVFTSCDDESEGGEPRIIYVRVTKPSAADSLLVRAGQGQMVAIMGENLQDTREVWFNDQKATLTATLITKNTVIVRVPSQIPEVNTHELSLIFANGKSLTYDFSLDISDPRVDRMKSEYVEEGDVATFYGDFFYEPVKVTFAGGVEAEVVTVEDQMIQVIVPAGAQRGPVTITSFYGESETNLLFRDNRNIFASFDVPLVSGIWKGTDYIVSVDPAINAINGKFVRVNKSLGAWPYFELYGGPAEGDIGLEAGKIPEGALIDPDAYSLKFEINTLKSLTGAIMRLHLGNANNDGLGAARESKYYEWKVNLDTGGEWETVTIPWADVYKGFSYAERYSMFIYFHGPNAVDHNFGLDNMRVVPNTNK